VEKIWRKTEQRAELHLGSKVVQLDPAKKSVVNSEGDEYKYDKLLIATGGTPNHLPFGNGNIIYYRTFQDYLHLRALTEKGDHFVVIGGSFIGSELAAALTIAGKKVTMVFPEDAISDSIFPGDLAHFLNDYYREKGVEVITGDTAASVQKEGKRIMVHTGSGRVIEADGVVAGIGIHPNLTWRKSPGSKSTTESLSMNISKHPFPIFTRPEMLQTFTTPRSKSVHAWSMKTTLSRWEKSPGATWPAGMRPLIPPCFTLIYLTWVMKPLGK
jgi:NADPH-dependent 2,4-dienoyl-CoA reductase/sulfur reductase-like enzyme